MHDERDSAVGSGLRAVVSLVVAVASVGVIRWRLGFPSTSAAAAGMAICGAWILVASPVGLYLGVDSLWGKRVGVKFIGALGVLGHLGAFVWWIVL